MNELTKVESNDVASSQQTVTNLGNDDVLVIAEQPGQMQAAQQALIAWATAKVESVKSDLAEAERGYDQAVAGGFRLAGIKKLLDTAVKTVMYYEKVKAALEEGYCIVPDFPVDVVAIRTEREAPSGYTTTGKYESGRGVTIEQSAQVLREGEGQFVSPNASSYVHSCEHKGEGASRELVRRYHHADEFREVSLPVKFMKPRVLEATQRAMASKIFDEIGILPASPKKDPLVVGRIIDPKGRRLSFLISWFVDSRDL